VAVIRKAWWLALIAVTISGCGLASSPEVSPIPTPTQTSEPPPDLSAFYAQTLDWRNCGNAECSYIEVPLDYADPQGQRVSLAVTRVPARGDSMGSLFINPGGPGGSAFDYAKAADFVVTKPIRERYDIVGVDPRGVGKSEPIRCLTDEEIDMLISFDEPDDSPTAQAKFDELARFIGEKCDERAKPLYAFMGTVNAARDMDIARAALGDQTFNYLGMSYGSYLGAVYAELFPERVGRVVLDGILSPEADAVNVSREQAIGLERAAEMFMTDCLQQSDCPFTGSVEDGMNQMRAFIDNASENPINTNSNRDVNGALAGYAILLHLYFPDIDYPVLREFLNDAINRGDGTALLQALDQRTSRGADGKYLDNSTDAYYAVTCLDLPFNRSEFDVDVLAKEWEQLAPTFGPDIAYGLLTCADWPATDPDRITSVRASGSAPILVVSVTGDPVTIHQWGIDLDNELENSALVTWNAFNHTGYNQGSSCVDETVDAYLLGGSLPPKGLICTD
jgi:pimeloyl-ACP methyl ester carboxylesterase